MSQIVLTNITANCDFSCLVDQDRLVSKCHCKRVKQSKTNKNFNSILFKCESSTCLIYKNGKVVIIGAKSSKSVRNTVNSVGALLGTDFVPTIKYTNYCASTNLGHSIKDSALYEYLRVHPETKQVLFEPEIFPTIKWDPKNLPSTINIFKSGKINSTGNKYKWQAFSSLKAIRRLIRTVSTVLCSFPKTS